MRPSLGRNHIPHWDFFFPASTGAVHWSHCPGTCSRCTLPSEKSKSIPALKNSLRETRALCFFLCAQNIDGGRVKRLFQPPCMKPIYATPGRLSLPHTVSHPQSAPAAAWPGFHVISAQHSPCASPTSARLFLHSVGLHSGKRAVGPCCSPKQVPAPGDLQSKHLCKRALPHHFTRCTRQGSR